MKTVPECPEVELEAGAAGTVGAVTAPEAELTVLSHPQLKAASPV